MGKGEFIGPKGGKIKKDKVEDKVEMSLKRRWKNWLNRNE